MFRYYVDADRDGAWEPDELEDYQSFEIEVVSHEEHLRRVADATWK